MSRSEPQRPMLGVALAANLNDTNVGRSGTRSSQALSSIDVDLSFFLVWARPPPGNASSTLRS